MLEGGLKAGETGDKSGGCCTHGATATTLQHNPTGRSPVSWVRSFSRTCGDHLGREGQRASAHRGHCVEGWGASSPAGPHHDDRIQ